MRDVKKIDLNENSFEEGIAEGLIKFKSLFRKNGGWTAYYLYENENDNPPLRIKYNESTKKGYDEFEFYYKDDSLIFAKYIQAFNKGRVSQKIFYYENRKLIHSTSLDKFEDSRYIKQTEKDVRNLIYN
jgi:hypothetical protein